MHYVINYPPAHGWPSALALISASGQKLPSRLGPSHVGLALNSGRASKTRERPECAISGSLVFSVNVNLQV